MQETNLQSVGSTATHVQHEMLMCKLADYSCKKTDTLHTRQCVYAVHMLMEVQSTGAMQHNDANKKRHTYMHDC